MRKAIAGIMVLTFLGGASQVAVAAPKKNNVYSTPLSAQYDAYEPIELDEAVLENFVRSSKAKKGSYMAASNSPISANEKTKKASSIYVRTPSLLDGENQRKEMEQQKQFSPSVVAEDWEFLPSNRRVYDSSNDIWLDSNFSLEERTNPNVVVVGYTNYKNENNQQDFNASDEEIKQYNIFSSESTSNRVFRAGSDAMSKGF